MTPPNPSDQGNMVSQREGEWVLVPREPTEAMLAPYRGLNRTRDARTVVANYYRAMLSAAPPPEPGADEGGVSLTEAAITAAIREHVKLRWTPCRGALPDVEFTPSGLRAAANAILKLAETGDPIGGLEQ